MDRTYGGVALDRRRTDRRERLLLAALDLFTTVGYQRTGVARLCTAAGVSTRNFYEEFANKEAVLLALHARINELALAGIAQALGELDTDDPAIRIGVLLDVFVGAITADPRLPRLAYVEAVGVSPDLERQHQEWVTRWAALIEQEARRVAAAGHAPDRDYHLTAIALVGAITGLLREWQAHAPNHTAEEMTEEIKALMLAALTRNP